MRTLDYIRLAASSLQSNRMRSLLTSLGIMVGVAAVVLLTSLGGGVQHYILQQFSQFGAHIIAIVPGKASTLGISGAVISNVRPLTLDDAASLQTLNGVVTAVPVVQGNLPVEAGKLSRWTVILGVNHQTPQTWKFNIAQGQFLPDEPPEQARNLAVIGHKIKTELFPDSSPLGKRIRIGQDRFRVIGVMEKKGQILGFDMDDAVYIPVYRSMALFNRESLMEIDLLYLGGWDEANLVKRIKTHLIRRHGTEDFTINTQSDMLGTLDSILNILKAVIAGLGGISLIVGGVGIFTIMSIAVNERIREIGLLRALGASRQQVTSMFLLEATTLSALGGLSGLVLGLGVAGILQLLFPAMPVHVEWSYVLLAELIAILTGIIAGLLPARRAAALPPIEALRFE